MIWPKKDQKIGSATYCIFYFPQKYFPDNILAPKEDLFFNLRGFVSVGRQKSGFKSKKNQNVWILTRFSPTKMFSVTLIIIAKLRSLPTFLCRKFISNVFGLSSMTFRMEATHFSWQH